MMPETPTSVTKGSHGREWPVRVALIIGADSYVPHADAIASAFSARGWKLELFILSRDGTPAVNNRQLSRMVHSTDGLCQLEPKELTLNRIFSSTFWKGFDAVFLGVHGTLAKKVLDLLKKPAAISTPHPLAICCFPGVSYYLQSYGQWLRARADIVLFNERRTYQDYKKVRKFISRKKPENALLFGYPSLTDISREPVQSNSILYVDQNVLPAGYKDRLELVEKLFDLAEARPEYTLRILARNKPTEQSNHNALGRTHIETLVEEVRRQRSSGCNLVVEFGAPKDYLATTSLCLGITSTILLHAMYLGISTIPLRVNGVRGAFNGYKLFQKSPMAMQIEDLIAEKPACNLDSAWAHANILATNDQTKMDLCEMVLRKLSNREPIPETYQLFDILPSFSKAIFGFVDFLLHFKIGSDHAKQ
jgi:hypothetical protein